MLFTLRLLATATAGYGGLVLVAPYDQPSDPFVRNSSKPFGGRR
jgi:hypothetical protein